MTKFAPCYNHLTITAPDELLSKKIFNSFLAGRMLSSFFPAPDAVLELLTTEYPAYCSALSQLWGTVHDIGGDPSSITVNDNNTLVIQFESSFTPPRAWYEKMHQNGFIIEAYFDQPQANFFGVCIGNDQGYQIDYYDEENSFGDERMELFPEAVLKYFQTKTNHAACA